MNDRRSDITELSNIPAPGDMQVFGLVIDEETSTVLSGDRDPFDRVAEEFVDRCRRGETPSIAEYVAQFPGKEDKVRKLLSAVATMEQLRRGSRQARFMPERIGEFRVLRELGRGGMGVVYEAVQESLWRHVAVKAIHHSQLDQKRLQRFQREAQAVAQLHHTNIVPIFGVGEHDGIPYYAMQYIKGRGLDALLETWREGNIPQAAEHWRSAARYAKQAAEALGYAHDQGVFHRDIKPANILIDELDAVWITDFGLAKIVGHEELTASGDVIGTLRYLAPESLRGVADGRGDIYSLGLTLYEMLTLNPPFGMLSPSELLHKVSEGQPTRPRTLDPSIPRDLETIVLKATARDLKDRYPTAHALASDLDCFLRDRPIQARRVNLAERAWRWSRRNKMTAVLLAMATALLVLTAVAGWTGYVISNAALESERISLAQKNRYISMFNDFLPGLLDALIPEDPLKDNYEVVPITQPLMDAVEGDDSPRVFADRTERLGPGGRHGPPIGPGQRMIDGQLPPSETGPRSGGRRPGQGGWFDLSERERTRNLAIFRRVLATYDQFAQSQNNQTDAGMQSQAAWVYYKMGALSERLNHRVEADAAFDRMLKIFDELATLYPRESGYFQNFLKICSAINPWQSDDLMRREVEGRLQRMEQTLGRLLVASPTDPGYLRARMQLLAKLGLIRQAQDRSDSIGPLREALGIAGQLIGRSPEDGYPHSDRSDILEACALVAADQGKASEARGYLEKAFEDLEWVAADELKSEPLASRMESLADDFERIGDIDRSRQIQDRADQIDPRPPLADRPKPGRPFAPRREDPAMFDSESQGE